MEEEQIQTGENDNKADINALEVLLFAAGDGLLKESLQQLLHCEAAELTNLVMKLNEKYHTEGSLLEVRKVDNNYVLTVQAQAKPLLHRLFDNGGKIRLSNQAYEVLAAISYNQPCTRAQVELVRGVNSDSVINNLADLGLIEKSGVLEMPGHPALYVVTAKFLRLFGLSSTKDLPVQPLLMYESLQQLNDQVSAAGIEN